MGGMESGRKQFRRNHHQKRSAGSQQARKQRAHRTVRIVASRGNGVFEVTKQQRGERHIQRRHHFHERRTKDLLAGGVSLEKHLVGEDAEKGDFTFVSLVYHQGGGGCWHHRNLGTVARVDAPRLSAARLATWEGCADKATGEAPTIAAGEPRATEAQLTCSENENGRRGTK